MCNILLRTNDEPTALLGDMASGVMLCLSSLRPTNVTRLRISTAPLNREPAMSLTLNLESSNRLQQQGSVNRFLMLLVHRGSSLSLLH